MFFKISQSCDTLVRKFIKNMNRTTTGSNVKYFNEITYLKATEMGKIFFHYSECNKIY